MLLKENDCKGDDVFWPLILSDLQDTDQGDKLWVGLSLHGQLDTLKITHSRTTQTELWFSGKDKSESGFLKGAMSPFTL